ncbi:hypothetical protein HRbin36_00364 [bacterium HR36]|nr:hypothetical protein HRbin36_00364 [bacterium HR36]
MPRRKHTSQSSEPASPARSGKRPVAPPAAETSPGPGSPPGETLSAPPAKPAELGTRTGSQSRPASARQELARQVLELRLAGFTYQEIRHLLGLKSDWQVWLLQRRALKQFDQEEYGQVRQLEWARLDRLIRGLWRKAMQGDLPTLDRLIKLLHQRERYVRQWAKQAKSAAIPRMTLFQALAADRQLEAWLQHCRPKSTQDVPLPEPNP